MFVKLTVFACFLAAASAVYNGPLAGGQPAALYPAGVSPQACPNFPNCANPAVAANPQAAAPHAGQWGGNNGQWNGANNGQWNAGNNGQWNAGNNGQWNAGNNGQWNGNNGQWNGANQWNNAAPVPQWNGNSQDRLNRGEYIGDGDYHGEGLAEALAPGYASYNNNNYNQNNGAWNQGGIPPNAAQAHGVGQIPAGVDARSCPNYPFCA